MGTIQKLKLVCCNERGNALSKRRQDTDTHKKQPLRCFDRLCFLHDLKTTTTKTQLKYNNKTKTKLLLTQKKSMRRRNRPEADQI